MTIMPIVKDNWRNGNCCICGRLLWPESGDFNSDLDISWCKSHKKRFKTMKRDYINPTIRNDEKRFVF